MLAAGRRPAVLIVSIEAVDWSEIGFFDYVARLSPQTRVYVAGEDHHQEKLTAHADTARCHSPAWLPAPTWGSRSVSRFPPPADLRVTAVASAESAYPEPAESAPAGHRADRG